MLKSSTSIRTWPNLLQVIRKNAEIQHHMLGFTVILVIPTGRGKTKF